MEQKTFEKIKEELLLRANKAGACQIGYAMGLRSQSKADILKAITDNWFWVLRTARKPTTAQQWKPTKILMLRI